MEFHEALTLESKIKAASNELLALVQKMRDEKGYLVLGYRTWTDYVKSGRIGMSPATLYRKLTLAQNSQIEKESNLPQSWHLRIAKCDPSVQPSIYQAVSNLMARGETMTAGRVDILCDVYEEGTLTGYAYDGDGNALGIAMRDAEEERKRRQHEHIGKLEKVCMAGLEVFNGVTKQHVRFIGDEAIPDGEYVVYVYRKVQ